MNSNQTNNGMWRPGFQPGNIGNQQLAQPKPNDPLTASGEYVKWHSHSNEIELYLDNANANPYKTEKYQLALDAVWIKNNKIGVGSFRGGDLCECYGFPINIIIYLAGQNVI